jgi:hypothetical protein
MAKMLSRKVNQQNNSIKLNCVTNSLILSRRLLVTAKDNGVEINIYLDKPVPKNLSEYRY